MFKKVQASQSYQFVEGIPLEGKIVSRESGKGQDGKSTLYNLSTAAGAVTFWGSAVLDNNLKNIPDGVLVRITYLGMAKGKAGRNYKNYSIEVDDSSSVQY